LLVRAGLIGEAVLARARTRLANHGGTLPEILVLGGAIDDDALTRFLADHLRLPRVDPDVLEALPADARARLPASAAIELRAVPIAVDPTGTLTIAMSDPCDVEALDALRAATSTPVNRAVCTQLELAWCLEKYYGHTTELRRSVHSSGVLLSPSNLYRGGDGDRGDFRDEETGVTGPIKRIPYPPSPDELAPRSGEIIGNPAPEIEPDLLPAVVIADDPPADVLSMQADMASQKKTPAKHAVDDGWDVDGWEAPGNTIKNKVPESVPERVPERLDASADVVVAEPAAQAPVAPAPQRPAIPEPNAEAVAASADRLLGVVRALEAAESRDAVLDVTLAFMDTASPRTGFAARKGDALSSLRGKGAALGAEIGFSGPGAGPMMAAMMRAETFRDVVEGAEANYIATLFDREPVAVSAVPLVVRSKLVGAFFAEATTTLVDEHVAVVARAAGLALERVLKAKK
jgi:hypothetical protein